LNKEAIITMTKKLIQFSGVTTGLLAVLGLVEVAGAQPFTANNGDLLVGFRTTGGSYEVVANIGNITNFEALAPGVTITNNNFSPSQLSDAFSSYNNLAWSVSSAFPGVARWAGFPSATAWYTVPRSAVNTQSSAPSRMIASLQQGLRNAIDSVGSGAETISSNLGTSNNDNNIYFVIEASGDPNGLSAFIGDPSEATLGDFGGSLGFSVENTTPASFTSPVRSDLYQSCPTGSADPITGLTTGTDYYVGYFQFNPDGTLTFTRAALPQMSITRSSSTFTISFTGTSGAVYTLCHTNTAGLGQPVGKWATNSTLITGNGQTTSFTDTTSDPVRFYRLGASFY
jgi:hypothetical protein